MIQIICLVIENCFGYLMLQSHQYFILPHPHLFYYFLHIRVPHHNDRSIQIFNRFLLISVRAFLYFGLPPLILPLIRVSPL